MTATIITPTAGFFKVVDVDGSKAKPIAITPGTWATSKKDPLFTVGNDVMLLHAITINDESLIGIALGIETFELFLRGISVSFNLSSLEFMIFAHNQKIGQRITTIANFFFRKSKLKITEVVTTRSLSSCIFFLEIGGGYHFLTIPSHKNKSIIEAEAGGKAVKA